MPNEKIILDATCGGRMMWFNKHHPAVLYTDFRDEDIELPGGQVLKIRPDKVQDFTNMPYKDRSFKLVVFDPPHSKWLGKNSIMGMHYGQLLPTWETDIKAGFSECMRVLDNYGTLVFKWHTKDIKITRLLSVLGQEPLFGHTSGKHGRTIWMCFVKFPSEAGQAKEVPFKHDENCGHDCQCV